MSLSLAAVNDWVNTLPSARLMLVGIGSGLTLTVVVEDTPSLAAIMVYVPTSV